MALHLPPEFENYMKVRIGPEYNDFRMALEERSPVSLRYNPAKTLTPTGDQVPWSRFGRYLSARPLYTLDPRFHAGAYYVQEASSMFLEQAIRQSVDLIQPLTVLDLCAAPGGKSTHVLSLLSKESLLISNEVIRNRTSSLAENIQKWGHDNVMVTHSDPSSFTHIPGFFDLIVLDAPCSGEGLFRKEPEAIAQWSRKNIEQCSFRQKRIVSDVWPALKGGGTLIYSTCTYQEKENMDILEWLKSQQGVEFVKLSLDKNWNIETMERGPCIGYQFYPHRLKGEGFFISIVKKKEDRIAAFRTKDNLKLPATSQIKELSNWVTHPESQHFFLHNQTIRMIPAVRKPEMLLALNHLNVLAAGTAIAEITKNKLVPHHALALSTKIRKENFNRIPVSHAEALEYLRKNPLRLSSRELGFAFIEVEELGLGWVNVLQNRINNLYPVTWRIRMRQDGPALYSKN